MTRMEASSLRSTAAKARPDGLAAMLTPSRLVIARKRRGLTLTRLAELTGLSTRSISLYENGHQAPARTRCC